MRAGKSAAIFVAPGIILGAAALLVAVSTPAQNSLNPRIPIVRDWSHRYVAYSNASFRAATLTQLQRDPRLLAAWVQRNAIGALASANAPARQSWRRTTLRRDWAVSLGNNVLTPGAPEVFPAMWGASFTQTSCTDDFVVFPINATPGMNQANIVAFNYLYDTCEKPVPRTRWAYRVGNGRVRTSPVLSLDGTEVAFVENNSAGATFHVLKWQAGQGENPTSPATPGSGSWVRSVTYASGATNTRSSPFVDYRNNVAFVGADNGVLYAIGPVFGKSSGDSLRVLGSVTVESARILTSPVMDPNQNRVFISDGSTLYSYPVSVTSNGVTFGDPAKFQVEWQDDKAIQDSPLLDIDRQRVFWFARQAAMFSAAVVIETRYDLTGYVAAQIGPSSSVVVRSGAFDDAHYNNPNAGQLLVCGKDDSDAPILYVFGFSQGRWSLSSTNRIAWGLGDCSPLTTFKGGDNRDRLFLGVSNYGGQIQMWYLPISGSSDRIDLAAGMYAGGSSGIIIDNRSEQIERNNIYFQTREASGQCQENNQPRVCAVKLTQAGLQ